MSRFWRWAAAAAVALVAACGPRDQDLPFEVELIAPQEGQTIGGAGVLLLAGARGGSEPTGAIFEYSSDGAAFRPYDGELGPDYGPGYFTRRLDTTAFPPGVLFLRVSDGLRSGAAVRVTVNRLPEVSCRAEGEGLSIRVDCSESFDPDGQIDSYLFSFGDGDSERSAEPLIAHRYAEPGVYDLLVAAFDGTGMFDHWQTIVRVVVGAVALVRPPDGCGCEELALATSGTGALRDSRRRLPGGGFARPPLGPDPQFPTVNFEIAVRLTPGSKAELCREGQELKRTVTSRSGVIPPRFKSVCTRGRPRPRCLANPDCDTRTCAGGGRDGQSCDGMATTPQGQVIPRDELCELGGGSCAANGDGVCTFFPFDGAMRGDDDYRKHFPGDEGVKFADPGGDLRWLDHPGMRQVEIPPDADMLTVTAALQKLNFVYQGDFLAFVRGDRDCRCHFRVIVDYLADTNPVLPGLQPGHGPRSGITLIQDAETVNCVETAQL